jgi:hypothetical protein
LNIFRITIFFDGMKRNKFLSISVVFFAITLGSCSNDGGNGSILVAEYTVSDFDLKIYESIATEADDGATVTPGESVKSESFGKMQWENNTLKSTIANLLGISGKYIHMDDKLLAMKYINFTCEGVGKIDKRWIADKIISHYGLKLDQSTDSVQGYSLVISDSAKLSVYKAFDSESYAVDFTNGRLTVQKNNLQEFAKELDGVSREYVKTDVSGNTQYNINVNLYSISKMKGKMEERFGLSFEEASWELTRYSLSELQKTEQ